MRLNSNTYPAYNTLEKGDFYSLNIDQMFGDNLLKNSEQFKGFMESLIFTYKQVSKKYYLTNTFKDAIYTATPKIHEGNKQYESVPSDCGVIFTDKGFSIYLSNPTDKKLKLLCYGFTRNALTTYGYITNEGLFGGLACSLKNGKPYDDQQGLANYLSSFLTTLYFIHNCEIEQRVLQPNQKDRANGEKHLNESKSDLTILDCRWFTELIRDTPFSVKGHLRWQVHGEKHSKRKLIWINDFEKSGYTRKPSKTLEIQ